MLLSKDKFKLQLIKVNQEEKYLMKYSEKMINYKFLSQWSFNW